VVGQNMSDRLSVVVARHLFIFVPVLINRKEEEDTIKLGYCPVFLFVFYVLKIF
jgi:hypothetical protein